MGNVSTGLMIPQPSSTDHFSVMIKLRDKFVITNAGKDVVKIITNVLNKFLEIQRQKYREDTVTYEYKIAGLPFIRGGSKEESFIYKEIMCILFQILLEHGWDVIASSDMAQKCSNSTIFFEKVPPLQQRYACIAPSSSDKILLVRIPPEINKKIIQAIKKHWVIQESKEATDNIYQIKLAGYPWSQATGESGIKLRFLLLEIIKVMRMSGYRLIINVNLKGTADSLFFRYDSKCSEDLFMMSLGQSDRLRLINAPDYIVNEIRVLIKEKWAGGLQAERWYHDCYEYKMKGNPWCADGIEAVASRIFIQDVLKSFLARGWEINSAIDLSRRLNDKSVFILQLGPPRPDVSVMCISFHTTDKVRLSFPTGETHNEVYSVINRHMTNANIIQSTKSYGLSHQWKTRGMPFRGHLGRNVIQEYCLFILLKILKDLKRIGWGLYVSADISAKYYSSDNDKYPLDVHSWFFIRDH